MMSVTPETIERDFKRSMLACLPSLRAFAVSLCKRHDYADDLVQDTIMKAWAKKESFEHGTNMKAWLFTILRNEFYSQARKSGREQAQRVRRGGPHRKDADTEAMERRLSDALGLEVTIDHRANGGGTVQVRYRTLEQLDEVIRRLEKGPDEGHHEEHGHAHKHGPKVRGL